MKVLFDTNVILDALQKREPWADDAEKLFLLVASDKIEGFVTAKQLCDIWYLASQIYKSEENSHKKAQKHISDLIKVFNVLDVTGSDIEEAIAMELSDYEDAVMSASAVRNHLDAIVTRNTKDFPGNIKILKIYTPSKLLELFF